jgi:phosphoribosylformimino-5-aminoimidazole carboxamide ribotide isomerase
MIEIIPAIDLIDGKCVRLTEGDFARETVYSDHPLEMAKSFEAAGLRRLHIVDLDGAKSGTPRHLHALESIARGTSLIIDYGGGTKTDEDVKAVFEAGASMATIGSSAVKTPELFFSWIKTYGSDKILLGADVRHGKIAINGWQTGTDLSIVPFLTDYFAKGVNQAFVTDITVDGMLIGPSLELYQQIRKALPDLKLIASGGVSRIDDVEQLDAIGCAGVIVGKAIYEGKITLKELSSIGSQESSPPYEGGVAAASADGVVLSQRSNE